MLGGGITVPDLRVVNTDSIANRALVTVIAIMTFLGALFGGAASMVRSASQDWSASLSSEITIQIKPALGRDIAADQARSEQIISKFPGVMKVRSISQAESGEMLRPWLGTGFDLKDLPIPQLLTVKIDGSTRIDMAALAETLRNEVPTALVDDHKTWRNRLEKMSDGLIGVSFFVLALFVLAMGLAVSFATRGAMASSREVVDVLHFVGASDQFIAKEFQRHFLKLGLAGAAMGTICAVLIIRALGWASERWLASRDGEQVEALFGRLEIDSGMVLIMLFVALAMTAVTGAVSRSVVINLLKQSRQA